MAPLDEPTIAELIRRLGDQLSAVGANVASVQQAMTQYVTQEQRAADKELAAHKEQKAKEDRDRLDERITYWTRMGWTVLILPTIAGVMIWLLTGGKS